MREAREELSLQARLTRGRAATRPKPIGRRARLGRRRSSAGARGRGVLMLGGGRLRRSTVKASYARNLPGSSWAAHGTYLAREGAQREGSKGRGFDVERDGVDLTDTLRRWQQAGDARLWKFIVSPEHGERLDLHAHTRALVARMEQDLGTPLEWAAIDHHNTDNPHVHLLVRGRDGAGRPLEMAPQYLKAGLRARSSELVTSSLGWRTEREHLLARGNVVEHFRLTEIDRTLLRRADHDGLVTYEGPRPKARAGREIRLQELKRLQYLTRLGLADRVGTRTWRLASTLESRLREAQVAGDIIKSRARHLRQVSDPRMPVVVTELTPGMRVTGRLVGTGLADELHDRRYLLIEGTDQRLHYIAQTRALERARGSGRLSVGDTVTLSAHAAERGGRQVVETRLHVQPAKTGPTGRPTERARAVPEPGSLPSLKAVEHNVGRRVAVVQPVDGAIYRGRLAGYARGQDNRRYAVVDLGREIVAFRTEDTELTAGREVRAEGHREDDDRRRRLIWRLGADEHEQRRERSL